MRLTSDIVEIPKDNQLRDLSIFHAQKNLKEMLLKKVNQFKRMRQYEFADIGSIVVEFNNWDNILSGQRIDNLSLGRRITALQASLDWIDNIEDIGNPIESWWLVISIWLALAKYGVVNLISNDNEYVPNEPNIIFNYENSK